jgi:hypothetical protein
LTKKDIVADRYLLGLGAKARVQALETEIDEFTNRFESAIQPMRDEVAELRQRFPAMFAETVAPARARNRRKPKAATSKKRTAAQRKRMSDAQLKRRRLEKKNKGKKAGR